MKPSGPVEKAVRVWLTAPELAWGMCLSQPQATPRVTKVKQNTKSLLVKKHPLLCSPARQGSVQKAGDEYLIRLLIHAQR